MSWPRKSVKILVPNFVHTRPKQENSEKENSKKIEKIKKVYSGIISIQKGLSKAEKERKKNLSPIPFIFVLCKKTQKKIAKKLRNHFPALSLAKTE